ncbi:MAG: arsenate reductase (glutaredoxin) [Bacteroidetes bacterium]|nr:arsenate reductase (glutaredoxin) [Bacteroidota bacterium]
MRVLVYHNGECSKCKELTEILVSKGIEANYKFYLYEQMTIEELSDLLKKLNLSASSIIRASEPVYIEQYQGAVMSEEEWLQVIINNPVLLQRPIVVNGDKAIIARPPEKLLEIL